MTKTLLFVLSMASLFPTFAGWADYDIRYLVKRDSIYWAKRDSTSRYIKQYADLQQYREAVRQYRLTDTGKFEMLSHWHITMGIIGLIGSSTAIISGISNISRVSQFRSLSKQECVTLRQAYTFGTIACLIPLGFNIWEIEMGIMLQQLNE